MKTSTRREFLQAGASLLALASISAPIMAAESAPSKRAHKKAIMWGTVGVKGSVLEKMKAVKAAGFDGAEMNSHMDQAEVLKAREATGL
jgi:L-ribulose-5-phosphate 3-epimerase